MQKTGGGAAAVCEHGCAGRGTSAVAEPGWMWLLLLPPLAALAWRTVPVLLARYDGAALRVSPPVSASASAAVGVDALAPAWPVLLGWCFSGAVPGSRPFWRPWAPPQMTQRFAVAQLVGAPDGSLRAVVEAFSRHIDGSDQLSACSHRVARIGLRLRVKWHDAQWWRARQNSDPWDSGYLVDDPAALQALRVFRPRRATLLVAVDLTTDALHERIATLMARQAGFAHPVRLLVIGSAVPQGPSQAVPVLTLPPR